MERMRKERGLRTTKAESGGGGLGDNVSTVLFIFHNILGYFIIIEGKVNNIVIFCKFVVS